MGTHPTGNTSPAKLKPILYIKGYWPWYETTLYVLGKREERINHWGRKALMAYLVSQRLEEEHNIKDNRSLWK